MENENFCFVKPDMNGNIDYIDKTPDIAYIVYYENETHETWALLFKHCKDAVAYAKTAGNRIVRIEKAPIIEGIEIVKEDEQ
jgi:hypothetical protein